ncbi:hypothetical protein NQ314_002840 [Rhamnusium bicolor]|uniref:Ion transport domain-containing protein n=1 Tax=Rhamnusium bicolor TaxID=1586634 RepID=A0AAV8ZP50_9CUCU|nr:hypothetical protein NQ314_002840 [Rhamnusium bicolor]
MGANNCKPCRKKKKALSGGSILDRVISQASNQDQCLLYKLANYKKGNPCLVLKIKIRGQLIEAYNVGGQAEVEKLIREQFGQLMYQEGKGQIINRSEYLRWKFRDHEQVILPIEASLSQYDPLGKWTDHEACWQMQYRGSLGESLLHVLIICDTKIHTRLARTLIKCFPKLALDVVEGEEYLGASALHLAIAYNNNELVQDLDMFGYALRHPKLPSSNGKVNKAGLTPLTLACKLGRAEVFREMLELSAKEFWRYSNITCSGYTLNALDTLLPDGRTNWNSALFIILNGTKEEHLDMLDGGIIQRLLEEKWKTFARNQFLKRLLILVVHLIFMSLAVYLRPDDPDEPLLLWTDDPTIIARYCCEVGTILGVLSYVIFQQGDEIRNQGLWTFLKQQSNSPPKTIFLVSNLLILACIPCRISGDRKTEEAILLFAVPGSWFLLMFFAGAVRLTGPFVTMIYSMITGDMLTFGIIYTIVLFGFSQSFFFLYKGFPGYQELGSTTYPGVAKSVFAIFMVFVPILLLNMLIAMMGNTYAHVIEQSEKEWMKQYVRLSKTLAAYFFKWAKIVITLERAIPQSDAHHYLQEYSISLGPSEDPSIEQRGVMVIKSKNKTRAKQRKGAVANWKRVGKVTINALKKKGLTGEELRCLMWGRESINTPIKVKGRPKDPLMDPHGPNITGGFGDALTVALDVMSFTHELDINGAAQGLNLSNNPKAINNEMTNQKNVPDKVAINNQKNAALNMQIKNVALDVSGSAMFGALTQLADSQGFRENMPTVTPQIFTVEKPPVPSNLPASNVPLQVEDPLRELVLCSSHEDADPEKLKFLALSAANLAKEKEAAITQSQTSKSVKSLAGIFTGTGAFVKKVEENLKKKYAALEPSDSEGFGEGPLLGKISRTRRAKSAHLRNSSAKSKLSDKRKLVKESDSSSIDTVIIDENKGNWDYDPRLRVPIKNANFAQATPVSTVEVGMREEQLVAPIAEQRVCRSANDKLDSEDSESPDPLEPWSTKKYS